MFKKNTDKRIYLDNSASTAVDPRVIDAMAPYWSDVMGNPGSLHEEGVRAKEAVEDARTTVAKAIGALPQNIIFTSGGTESNNLAILGTVNERISSGAKVESVSIVTSTVEHKSVLDAYNAVSDRGVHVEFVQTDKYGKIDIEKLENVIHKNTALISLVYVNNEIGTIQDIQSVAKLVRKHRKENDTHPYPLLHIDASQAPAWLKVDVVTLGVDMLTLDSQKLYGPKGVGCLYIKDLTTIKPILYGGGQESGLRPGTPPTPLIVGFARALDIVEEERVTYVSKIRELRDWFIWNIEKNIPYAELNGPVDESRNVANVNFSFPNIDNEQIVIEMDVKGVAVSTGSACLNEENEGSHVIKALGKAGTGTSGAVRISLGRWTSKDEVEKLPKV